MLRTPLLVLAGAVLVASAGPAESQMRRGPDQLFENADANQDGIVTREEYRAARAKTFGRIDRNGDGFIDSDDMPKRRRARAQGGERLDQLREQFDSNGDGRVSREEFAEGPTLLFDRADKDGNGQLDAEEIEAAKAAARNARESLRERRR